LPSTLFDPPIPTVRHRQLLSLWTGGEEPYSSFAAGGNGLVGVPMSRGVTALAEAAERHRGVAGDRRADAQPARELGHFLVLTFIPTWAKTALSETRRVRERHRPE